MLKIVVTAGLVIAIGITVAYFGYLRPRMESEVTESEPATNQISGDGASEKKPEPPKEPEPHGKFLVSYDEVKAEQHQSMRETAKASGFLETFADSLNREFILPTDVTLALSECGVTNAFYLPSEKKLTLCYEIIEKINTLLGQEMTAEQKAKPVPFDQAVLNAVENMFGNGPAPVDRVVYSEQGLREARGDAIVFIFYHELGHALVDVFGIPITGKEEDAVDQVATLLLAREGQKGELAAINAAVVWGQWGKEKMTQLNFSDEHSLDQQRFYNMMCWAYGREPTHWEKKLIESGLLPKARAGRCEAEYRQLEKSWHILLAPHLTAKAKDKWERDRVAQGASQ